MTISVWFGADHDNGSTGQRTIEVDLAIVGGGIIGAAAAYFARKLARPGQDLKIAVLEGKRVAGGTSGRSAGFVLRGIHAYYNSCVSRYGRAQARYIYEFGEENQRLIREFVSDNAADFDMVECGSYILASSLEEFDHLFASVELMKEDGFKLDLHHDDPLDRGFYGAIFNPGDFGINPLKLVRALLSAADCELYEEESVLRLTSAGAKGRVELQTSSMHVLAERVILATNAYSPLFEPFFLDKVNAVRGQMLATAPLKKKLLKQLCYANYGFEYFRQLPDLRLLVGGCRQLFPDEEVGYGDVVTRHLQNSLEHYMKDRFPELAGCAIDYRWSGIMAFTEDGLPLVGELPQGKGVFFAVGCNGHGLGYGLNMGKLVVDVAFEGACPGIFKYPRVKTLSPSLKFDEKGP